MDQKILDAHVALELVTDVFVSAINESKLDKVTVGGLAMACADIRLALEKSQAVIDHQLILEHDRIKIKHDQRIQDDIRAFSECFYPLLRR